ncbi:MAG: hypothetical protein L0271_02545 [Gemmatimonadetes bacterium]|nr:hypothetical protein [Gemmatimonadota bacterium]
MSTGEGRREGEGAADREVARARDRDGGGLARGGRGSGERGRNDRDASIDARIDEEIRFQAAPLVCSSSWRPLERSSPRGARPVWIR